MSDQDLIELALRVAQRTSFEGTNTVVDATADIREPAPQEPAETENPPAPLSVGLTRTAQAKEKIAADEVAAMILADLRKIAGCPAQGISVTVYGSNPWNSWLSFGGAAGPVPNKIELQEFCDIITERLKRLYDVF